jgi:hypothetical protein
MAHEAVKDSTELQIELIQGVHGYGAHQDVAFWVKKYGISISDLPEHVQSSIDLSSSRFGLFCELPIVKFLHFSSAEPVCDNSQEDKFLPFPLPLSSILIVDSPESLNSFISDGLKVQFSS